MCPLDDHLNHVKHKELHLFDLLFLTKYIAEQIPTKRPM